jgi:predicted ATPase
LVSSANADSAVDSIESGLRACRSVGFEIYRPLFLGYLAEALLRTGDNGRANDVAAQALTLARETRERADESELLRMMGRIRVARVPVEAERYFQDAAELACQQGAPLLELRAATDLARLWRDQRRRNEARALLTRIYGWFGEDLETPDLVEARKMLHELRDESSV